MIALARAKRWGALAAEACGSLVLVLVLYWLFMLFLYAIFPSGTPLRELMESPLEPGAPGYQGGRQPEAVLSELLRDVRFRRGNSIAWGGASAGMRLYSQDAVQTFDRSGARVAFDSKDNLEIGSNSLIVVTRLSDEDQAGSKSYRVKVEGELRGNLAAARKLKMEFEAAGHLARIGAGTARFRVSRTGGNSASLSVYSGEAELLENGRVVRVPANYAVALRKGGEVGTPVPIPAAPELGEGAGATIRYRLLPPKVRFSWSGAQGDYHFQLSRERAFGNCEIDQRVSGPELVTGKLVHGSYYWRVSRFQHGVEGRVSRVGECRLQQQLGPPPLRVDFPKEGSAGAGYLLSGSSEPGCRVFIDGVEVEVGEAGAFARAVALKPGVNLIRVEALDATGNASYASRIVYRRSDGTTTAAQAGPQADRPGGDGNR
jgi:hypothetical protein